jgi:hypothetical protein
MKYFSLLIVAGAVLFGACKNGNTPKTSKELLDEAQKTMNSGSGKYAINAPEGWRRTDTALNGIKVTFLFAPTETDGFKANINVVTETAGKLSLQEYADRNYETMSKYMGNFTAISKGDKDINGMPAKWLKYSSDQTGGKDIVALNYVMVKNGIAYIITGVMKAQDDARLTPVVESTAATFKITE